MSIFVIVFGALVAAFAVACILLPNDAIDYGTAGIAIIISKLTGMNLSQTVFFVFLPFLFLGFFFLFSDRAPICSAWSSLKGSRLN